MSRWICALAFSALLVACADGASPDAGRDFEGPGVAIDVAALNLQGVGDVVWDIEVENGATTPSVVWQRRVTSSGYGDGAGSASYVGPCDADANPNTVKVWVVGVFESAVSSAGTFNSTHDGAVGTAVDFQNPTTPSTPLTRTVTCQENRDTAVQFDVALMRPAQQGFFDIAVNFNDIYCSAKLDCCQDADGDGCEAGEDIELLFADTGARVRTIVLGFACTAGASDTGETNLYMDDLALDCDGADPFDADIVIDPSGTPGNQCTAGSLSSCAAIPAGAASAGTYLHQVAVYRGSEDLTSGGVDAQKAYWNVALGVTGSITSCRLRTAATADDASDDGDNVVDGVIAAGTVYPYVQWDVTLDNTCASEELTFGSTTASVRAAYTGTGDDETAFDYVWAPGAPTADRVGAHVIFCEATRSDSLAADQSYTITFTAEECGGELPGEGWVGMLGAFVSNNYGSEDTYVVDPPSAPGVGFYLRGSASSSQYVSAVYVDSAAMAAGDLITCEVPAASTVSNAAHHVHTWTDAECGGAAPGAGYSFGLGSATQWGSDEDWVALSDGIRFYMRAGSGPGGTWRVHYLRDSSPVMQDAVVCQRTADLPAASGNQTYTWNIANDCGGQTPTSDHVGVLFAARRGGEDANWRALNAGDAGGPGIAYSIASGPGATVDFGVLYLKLTPDPLSYPRTCKAILDAGDDTGDHVYTVDLDGAGGMDPLDVYCDMTGGGYTLLTNVYDSAGDDAPNDIAYAVSGWQQTGAGSWSATVGTVDRDISGLGSAALPSSVVQGLWDDGEATVLRMCLVSTTNAELCRTSDDGGANLTLTTPPAGIVNTTLAQYYSGNGCSGAGCAAAYTYGRLMGLPASRDDYVYASFGWSAFCIARTTGAYHEFGDQPNGLCEHNDSDTAGWRGVWHGWGNGVSFRPWETNDNELGSWWGVNPSTTSYGFRLWVR